MCIGFRFGKMLCAVLAAVLLMTVSCKKESEKQKKYLSGSLSLNGLPAYVRAGEIFLVRPSGIYHPDRQRLGYYFYYPITSEKDTVITPDSPRTQDSSFLFMIPDSLDTFSLTCYAYESGDNYYPTAGSTVFTVVDPDCYCGSLSGLGDFDDDEFFMDYRDEMLYAARNIDGLMWMRSDLKYQGLGEPYMSCDAMCGVAGNFYTWNEAMLACPPGWRLPSEADWISLAESFSAGAAVRAGDIEGLAGKLMCECRFNRSLMWQYWKGVKITNETHFSAVPFGYASKSGAYYTFKGINEYAAYWTSDSIGEKGLYRYIYKESDTVFSGLGGKDDMALPVRCVKNVENEEK